MPRPKKMIRKSTKIKKTGLAAKIYALKANIEKDNASLAKAYVKALADFDKAILRITKALSKEKSKPGKAKASGRGRPSKLASVANKALSLDLEALKSQKNDLQVEYKQFLAQQKALQKFSKAWTKKVKLAEKPKKRRGRKLGVAKQSTKKEESYSVFEEPVLMVEEI